MMSKYTKVAASKITALVRRPDFLRVTDIDHIFVWLEFDEQYCSVSEFGAVQWYDKNEIGEG